MSDLAILYYTANREAEAFEAVICAQIQRAAAGRPVVSVSQRPMDFGDNIVVGPRPACMLNRNRQILIGAEAVKTPWVALCESDTLYPPEFFAFEPDTPGLWWRYQPTFLVWAGRSYGFQKRWFETALLMQRARLMDLLTDNLRGLPEWGVGAEQQYLEEERTQPVFTEDASLRLFRGATAIVSIKTSASMHRRSGVSVRRPETVTTIPGWGCVGDLIAGLNLPSLARAQS